MWQGLCRGCQDIPSQIPECILTKAAHSKNRGYAHPNIVEGKPRTPHLPCRQAKKASMILSSNICDLCRPTTQCNSTNHIMPTTMARPSRPSVSRSADNGCPKLIDRRTCLVSCLKLLSGERQDRSTCTSIPFHSQQLGMLRSLRGPGGMLSMLNMLRMLRMLRSSRRAGAGAGDTGAVTLSRDEFGGNGHLP